MHLIITDAWLAKSKAIHLSGVQLVLAGLVAALCLMMVSVGLYHWVFLKGAQEGWPIVGSVVKFVAKDEFEQRDRTHGKSERRQCRIERVDTGAVIQQITRFVEIRTEDAIHVKARPIANNNDGFAELTTVLHRRRRCVRARLRGHDDLKQRHLVHRREEVHPDDAVGMRRHTRDLANRNCARI